MSVVTYLSKTVPFMVTKLSDLKSPFSLLIDPIELMLIESFSGEIIASPDNYPREMLSSEGEIISMFVSVLYDFREDRIFE